MPSKTKSYGWIQHEIALARARSGRWSAETEQGLGDLLRRTGLRISRRELLLIDGALYVSHAGLLAIARRQRCAGIQSEVLTNLSRPAEHCWVVQATVFKHARSPRGFIGLGDADPTNVSALVRGSELRVAETRAVNRALRKAYAVGLCSAEEIGGSTEDAMLAKAPKIKSPSTDASPSSSLLEISIRDRLKLILREHQLDPVEVLHYAHRFLGVPDLQQSSTEELARFASHLEQFAIANRTWLKAELSRANKEVSNPLAVSASEAVA